MKKTGVYTPKLFDPHEYATLRRLAELIIPADEVSGSAVDAGAPEFIDVIAGHNPEISLRMTGGIAWLDRRMEAEYSASFVDSKPAEQTAMVDKIANRKEAPAGYGPGVEFFSWVRRLTADAFYTSPIGIKDVALIGNKGMTKFQVLVATLEYAARRKRPRIVAARSHLCCEFPGFTL